MARLYARTGDDGTTRLSDGSTVPKAHPRVEACGALDELNSHLGVVRSALGDRDIDRIVGSVQALLFEVGATLADPKADTVRIDDADVAWLEQEIDRATAECSPLRSFILPGGAAAAAHLHVARTVCRRAERAVVALADAAGVSPVVVRFLNRLSDLLFALARLANRRAGVDDVLWTPRKR